MRSSYFPKLVNGPFGDPALYVRTAHRREAFLFDCGDLQALTSRELLKISHLFLSHLHIDHFVGFDSLLRFLLNRDKPLRIFGPAGTIERVESRLGGYMWNLTEGYPFKVIVSDCKESGVRRASFRAEKSFLREEEEALPVREHIIDNDSFRVKAVPLDHGGIVSMAYSLEESVHVAIHKDALLREGFAQGPWLTRFTDLVRCGASAETVVTVPSVDGSVRELNVDDLLGRVAHKERGMKITYVTDVSPTLPNFHRIVELASDSHLLVIEAAFAHEDIERARERGHLTAMMAGELARKSRAARLLVFHHSPRYLQMPDRLASEARDAFLDGR